MGLIDWLRRRFAKPPKFQDLHFASPEAALQYAGTYMDCDIVENALLPCVVDSVFMSPEAGLVGTIRLPSILGWTEYLAAFPKIEHYDDLTGKLCAAIIGPQVPYGDKLHAVLVVAVLEPSLTSKGWKVARRF